MAIGDLIVGPYPQYEVQGLLVGSGTDWIVEKVSGLLGTPEVRTTDIERQGAWGDYPGRNFYKARRVAMDLRVRADTVAAIEGYLDSARAKFLTSDTPFQLAFQRNNHVKQFLWAICEKSDIDSDYDLAHRQFKASVQWKCADPRIYSLTETATGITIANAATSQAGNITNNGTVDDDPWFQISGPCTNPRIANTADGNRQIKIDIVVASGHTLVIDVKSMTATMDGTLYPFRSDNQWFHLKPGVNGLTFSRSVGAAPSTLTVNYRDAWV